MKTNIILQGDALTKLKELPNESINCLMTSPPYWALRDYSAETEIVWDGKEGCEHKWGEGIIGAGSRSKDSHNAPTKQTEATMDRDKRPLTNFCSLCGAWKGQLGLEPTFEIYISHLADIFDEVKRVLRDDGTCFVNLGDTYSGGGRSGSKEYFEKGHKQFGQQDKKYMPPIKSKEVPDKCLTMIPFRFAIEMVNRGWILRNNIIWHKRNCMPSSVKDRFTVDFEYVFFFSKKKKYWFETQREPHKESSIERTKHPWDGHREPMSAWEGMRIEKNVSSSRKK